MPPLESRFKTVAICLDAICLGEPAKLNMTTIVVRVFAIVATFSRWRGSREHETSRRARAGTIVPTTPTLQILREARDRTNAGRVKRWLGFRRGTVGLAGEVGED